MLKGEDSVEVAVQGDITGGGEGVVKEGFDGGHGCLRTLTFKNPARVEKIVITNSNCTMLHTPCSAEAGNVCVPQHQPDSWGAAVAHHTILQRWLTISLTAHEKQKAVSIATLLLPPHSPNLLRALSVTSRRLNGSTLLASLLVTTGSNISCG